MRPSLKGVSRLTPLGLGVLIATTLGVSLLSVAQLDDVDAEWTACRAGSAVLERDTDSVIEALGYGGMIHQFESDVIRRDEAHAAAVEAAIGNGPDAIGRLRAFPPLSPAEAGALATIEPGLRLRRGALLRCPGDAAGHRPFPLRRARREGGRGVRRGGGRSGAGGVTAPDLAAGGTMPTRHGRSPRHGPRGRVA